jgi:hypothetical protein
MYINRCKNQIIMFNAMQARDNSICDTLILPEQGVSYEKDFCKQEVEMQLENDLFEKQQLEEQARMEKELEEIREFEEQEQAQLSEEVQ